MMARLTLLCPTYNRHQYLDRSCRFWQNRDVDVIYADGSQSAFAGTCLAASNLRYMHSPVGFYQRLAAMSAEVGTPYVCMMGDDEYYIPSSLHICVDYLDSHPDYVACMGRAIGFSRSLGDIVLKNQYPLLHGRSLSDDLALTRLTKHFSAYVPSHCYAVTRTDVFRSAIDAALSNKLDVYAISELIEEFLIVSAGKSIVLPILYWLRSFEEPPLRNTGDISLNLSKGFDEWWKHLENNEAKKRFCYELSASCSNSVDRCLVEHIFDLYHFYAYPNPGFSRGASLRWLMSALPGFVKKTNGFLLAAAKPFAQYLLNPSIQSGFTLLSLRGQGVQIDHKALAECLASIKSSWKA